MTPTDATGARPSARSLVHDVLGAQLAIAALVGAIAISALAWTSGSVVRNNLEQWAGQWAEELNEIGAPFYHDEREALLGVERFVAKFPEIDRVTWYREDGSVLMSLKHGGEQSDSAPPLPSQVRDSLAAKAGVTPPFLLTENVDRQRFRLSGPVWTEAFTGDGLFAFDPAAPKTSVALARLRDYRARLLRLRACVVPASRVRERRAAVAARRRLGCRHATPASLACAAIEPSKAARPARRGRHGGRIPELAAHRDPCDRDCARGHDPRAAQARGALGPSREPRSAHGALTTVTG